MSRRRPSTILVGLDGATFDVLDRLVAEGTMPFLGLLLAGGCSARLRTVVPPLTPAAWTSLATGVPPGRHGIFDFVRVTRQPSDSSPHADTCPMQYRMATSDDVCAETVWSLASRQDRRVAVLNFPVGIPPEQVAGIVVPGFAPWRHLRRLVWPPEFYKVLCELPSFRAEELVLDVTEERRAIQELATEEYEGWIDFHIRREERWLEVVRYVLEHEDCDLVAVLFDGVDKLQHICWRFIAPDPGTEFSDWEARVAARCRDYFARLDEIMAETVRLAGPAARVFVASDHGFGPTRELFYVNVWLERHGYLAWARGVQPDQSQRVGLEEVTRSSVALFDWTRTRVAALTSGSNGLYVKVSRFPGDPGVPPDEYEAFMAQLRGELLDVKAPDGRRVVAEALLRDEAFAGPQGHRAPDLTLRMHDHGFVSVLNAAEPIVPRRELLGTHHTDGVFAAYGPGIVPGGRMSDLSILDVAPALLYSLGLPVPCDFEGRFPREIFEPSMLACCHATVGPPTLTPSSASACEHHETRGAADDEQVVSRLKALGYLE